ncbi:hypothetical protein IEE91_07520 [Kocuria sp. cx-455]|uniref:DUF6270 domain-containing protein n=1 Tax=Kocuria sp. cx-455 TaxID=2771377 RepID=UPI0016878965|nr:DUF6270 domain-containing protein [Kocuria sp. cx-455]MBD2765035.1 hypothetical protein [Kocuria sp. cx-455]
MRSHTIKDYSRWGDRHYTHDDVTSFGTALSSEGAAGVHSLRMRDGETLDVLVVGEPGRDGRAIPVFLNGAVPARQDKTGPFFSGGRVGPAVASGYLSVSDPAVDRDPDVSLAWYAGHEGSDTRRTFISALEMVGSVYRRELVLVGGSGGGFAALYYASLVRCDVSAFVWNPQTDILAYNRGFVDTYLTRSFPEYCADAEEPATWLSQRSDECAAADIHRSVVTREHHDPRTIHRLLLLQNISDWHLTGHTVPYLKTHGFVSVGTGAYVLSPDLAVQVADWGQGHAPLPTELVVDHLRAFLDSGRSPLDIGRDVAFDERCDPTVVSRAPIDLRPLVPEFQEQWSASGDLTTGTVHVSIGNTPEGYGELRFGLIQTSGTSREQLAWFSTDTTIGFPVEKLWPDAQLMVVARDGLNNHLLHLPVELVIGSAETATVDSEMVPTVAQEAETKQPAVASSPFIYGSCVTRDAFALLERPNVAEYVARSPIVSAMAAPATELPAGMNIDLIDSAFQRRMVTWDVQKSLPELLSKTAHDAVVIDLIDERLGLLDLGHGRVLSLSTEAVKAGLTRDAGTLLRVGDPDFLSRWDAAAQQLIQRLQDERVILNRVFWAAVDENGQDLTQKFPVDLNNQVLEHMYGTLQEGLDCAVIDYPAELMVADSQHRWGLSPFHFTREFYVHFLNRLREILGEY